jgi:hypothetical protein
MARRTIKHKPRTVNSPQYRHSDGSVNTLFDALLDFESDQHFRPRRTKPTDAPPGTPEKISVLSTRLERGEELHHENDYRYPTPPHWMMIIQDIEDEVFQQKMR